MSAPTPPPSYRQATSSATVAGSWKPSLSVVHVEDDGLSDVSGEEDIMEDFKQEDVDPAVALRLIAKGKATGNRPALWTRSVIQGYFFRLGQFIHRHAGKVLVAGLILLCVCCLGLRNIQFETRLEKLWIEAGGRLTSELEYIQKIHGTEPGASPLILLQTPEKSSSNNSSSSSSLLTHKAFLLHLKAALVATEVEVEIFKTTWTLKDICHRVNFPNFDETVPAISPALDQLYPCSIISPLDCFWEGAKLLDPQNPVVIPGYHERLMWTNFDPQNLIAALRRDPDAWPDEDRVSYNAEPFITFLNKMDVRAGYVGRPCLNVEDVDCPEKAPNKKSGDLPNISEIVSRGCAGISHKYMKWNEELIFGEIKKNRSQQIFSASAMQTIFHISSANALYERLKSHMKTSEDVIDTEWTEEAAAHVIDMWQTRYAAEVAKALRSDEARETITVYNANNLQSIVASFSEFSVVRLSVGFSCVIAYVCFALKRWSDPVNSYSGLGIAGTFLSGLCVAAGISLSAFLRMDFNALSTQVVPFLALGLNVFYVVQLVQTLSNLVDEEVATDDLTGECLKQHGLSTVVSTMAVSAAFFAGYAIPIPALRTFSLQMGILTSLSCPAMLILFPAIVSLDQRRRFARRLDLFCCYGRPNPLPAMQYSQAAVVTIGGPRARALRKSCCASPARHGRRTAQSCTSAACRMGQPMKLGPLDQRLMESGMLPHGIRDLSGSTNSIFRADAPTCCNDVQATCETIHVSQWFLRIYLRLIVSSYAKLFVMLAFALVLGGSTWGMTKVEEGLDMTEFIPKDTPEHRYLEVSSKSFAWYSMSAVTKGGFEYQNHQQLLHDFHHAFQRIDQVVKDEKGGLPSYWLGRMREWLSELDATFDKEYANGCFTSDGWNSNASSDAILAFKLRSQTGRDDNHETDNSQVVRSRLVDRRGIINQKTFYHLLSAWAGNDELAYASTLAMLHPEPKKWIHDHGDVRPRIERSQPLDFAQFHFDLRGLRTTREMLKVVDQVRGISGNFAKQGLPNFPSGVVFSFWEQYVHLKYHLLVAMIILLIGFFVILSIALMNLWASALIVLMTVILLVEMTGLIGVIGIKLNAILAVILVLATGIGLKFSLRICMVFVMGMGCKNRRVQHSLLMSVWPVTHAAGSMLIGVAMLAFSGFDFVFRYFFLVLTGLIMLTVLNTLVFLPVLLSLLGPVADLIPNDDPDRVPALTPEPQLSRAMLVRNCQRTGRIGASMVSLSTISEEDSISCQQIFLEPQITVETTTSFPANVNGTPFNSNGPCDEKGSTDASSTASLVSTFTVSTRAKVKVEMHRPGSAAKSGSSSAARQQFSDDDCACQE
ncbi:Protein patched [Hypsibius exemplaris]|uniref:Protein patched n=1 Tax=Hypsibius exemplaris TaxID=2072580 RepID=A0A1W0WP64_HYPEX|nr:Protein patched [Hypsibius exemplaris]